MKNHYAPACPVSIEKADENTVRIVAIITALLTIIAIITNSYFLSFFIGIDFFLRGFTNGNYSFIKYLAKIIRTKFGLPLKFTNGAPKKFVAKIGLLFAASITILQLLSLSLAANIIGGILIACTLLEGVFGFCVACIIYPFVYKLQ